MVVGNLNMSTSSQCVKYLMFVFNLLFVITGIILLSIGSAIHGIYSNYHHFLDDRFFSVPNLLIAIGSIIFFIAFFGCCGAIKENYCMIVTFTALMVLVFILELSAGISGYVLKSDAYEVLSTKMTESMKQYNGSQEIYNIWDLIQADFKCCGTKNPEDWQKETTFEEYLPMSCCPPASGNIGNMTCMVKDDIHYKIGCIDAVSDFIKSHALQLGGAGLGIAFVQAIGIWFAIYLAKAIRRSYQNM